MTNGSRSVTLSGSCGLRMATDSGLVFRGPKPLHPPAGPAKDIGPDLIPSRLVGIEPGARNHRSRHIRPLPFLPLRTRPPRPRGSIARAWLERLADRLAQRSADVAAHRAVICRETLA